MRLAREARRTESRMTSAGLVHTNGFAAYLLCAAMKRRSSLRRSLTLVNEPRRTARRSSWPNHPSTALSQEALVGVKCSVKRAWAASQAVTSGVLCVLLLSSTRCSARQGGYLLGKVGIAADLQGLRPVRPQVRRLPYLRHVPLAHPCGRVGRTADATCRPSAARSRAGRRSLRHSSLPH